jgi:transcriptional regulator with GAF, ATPase, and Fis domain
VADVHNEADNEADISTIARELAEITRLVEDDDFGKTLERFVNRVAQTIPGCDDALITVRSQTGVESVSSTRDLGFDPILPGPIIEAVTFNEPRRLDDVGADQRWPAFAVALANAGYQSCLSLPLSTTRDDTAVLTLFAHKPDQFTESAYDVVLLLTLHGGAVFDNASLYHDSSRLVTQLRTALRTRALVGRAQGLLMRHFAYDTERAFAALTRASQNSNTKLRDLAGLIVNAHEDGNFEETLQQLALTAAGEEN